jgi:hypothetical protein
MSWDPNAGSDFQSEAPRSSEYQSRPPRPEPTEEQLQHRNYGWASNRARYEFNENAVDDQGMAPRDSALEAELFEENSAEQQSQLDFSKYEKIPVRVERGNAPNPIRSVKSYFYQIVFIQLNYLYLSSLKKLISTLL